MAVNQFVKWKTELAGAGGPRSSQLPEVSPFSITPSHSSWVENVAGELGVRVCSETCFGSLWLVPN